MINETTTRALKLISEATTSYGIMASPEKRHNYNRIWARDSVIAGIAGCLYNVEVIAKGLESSLNFLSTHQGEEGAIPSNISIADHKVSYGGLAGRVDATLWYIVGVGYYSKYTQDQEFLNNHKPHILKALSITQAWEYNGRGLIYTPLSGNWADEYPLHGYLLYDNALRLLGLKILNDLLPELILETKIKELEDRLQIDFWIDHMNQNNAYHPGLYARNSESFHLMAGFNPGEYYNTFDAAGHGIALLTIKLSQERKDKVSQYVTELFDQISTQLIPAFWPVITEINPLWSSIRSNYTYTFKNLPHQFHNGGIWPVMMGLFSMGGRSAGIQLEWDIIKDTYKKILLNEDYKFSEFINSRTLIPGGQSSLCFSAAGWLFMNCPIEKVDQFLNYQ